MKFVFIVAIISGIFVYSTMKLLALFDGGTEEPKTEEVQETEKSLEKPVEKAKSPATPAIEIIGQAEIPPMIARPDEPVEKEPETLVEQKRPSQITAVYRFENRVVPPIDVLKAEIASSSDFTVLVDERTNSWIFKTSQDQMPEYLAVASALDLVADELDLDFLLVAVSEQKISTMGLTARFAEGSSVLSALDLGFDTFGLNLALGDTVINVDLERSNQFVEVVSLPVVRTVTGEEFLLQSVDEVPIATTTFRDNVETQSFDYRDVGLVFKGTARRVGHRYWLELTQESGTVIDQGADGIAPLFRTENLKTSTFLIANMWTPLAASTVERKVWKRGLFSKKDENQRDLLILFCRPRETLDGGIPTARPIGFNGQRVDLSKNVHPFSRPAVLPGLGEVPESSKATLEELEERFFRDRDNGFTGGRPGRRK